MRDFKSLVAAGRSTKSPAHRRGCLRHHEIDAPVWIGASHHRQLFSFSRGNISSKFDTRQSRWNRSHVTNGTRTSRSHHLHVELKTMSDLSPLKRMLRDKSEMQRQPPKTELSNDDDKEVLDRHFARTSKTKCLRGQAAVDEADAVMRRNHARVESVTRETCIKALYRSAVSSAREYDKWRSEVFQFARSDEAERALRAQLPSSRRSGVRAVVGARLSHCSR